jgi:hypothetical protein
MFALRAPGKESGQKMEQYNKILWAKLPYWIIPG